MSKHEHNHEHEHEHNHEHEHCHDAQCGCHEHNHHHHANGSVGGCSCCETGFDNIGGEKGKKEKGFFVTYRKETACLIVGAIMFVGALVLEHTGIAGVLPICVIAYIVLGHNVLINSARNITKGKVFDENFLMAVATLAAFFIGDYPEAVGIMLFYNVGEMFETVSVDRSKRHIAEAVDMRPETVFVVNESAEGVEEIVEIPAGNAKAGEIIRINPGDRIPLDGKVSKGQGIIDTSPITGEPMPVHATEGSNILSGCINMRGRFHMEVTSPLEESMVSKILKSVESAAENKPEIEKFITKFARIYTPIVVVLAFLVAVLPPLIAGATWKYWIVTAVTFLVISCPCAMVISVPLAYFIGVGSASRLGILVKSGHALETLRRIKIVAMDKTGTLTKGTVDDAGLFEIDEAFNMREAHGEGGESFEESFRKKTVSGDELKEDSEKGVEALKQMGIRTAMLTGDKRDRAMEIAKEAGIDDVKCELLPDEKLTALEELRDEYGEIMFVGDGINDAPVLAGSDIGAAMGSGADAAIESADIVFMNSNITAISETIKISKRTGQIAVENIVLALIFKLLVIGMGVVGFANIWMAVFADTGVAMLCILNSLRLLKR